VSVFKEGYYYLHVNGQLIYKSAYGVDAMGAEEYFDSPYVVKYWYVKSEMSLNMVKVEAKELSEHLQ
jgi:hypothetical protein